MGVGAGHYRTVLHHIAHERTHHLSVGFAGCRFRTVGEQTLMPMMRVGHGFIGGDDTQEQLAQDTMCLEVIEQRVVAANAAVHLRH